ncbi:CPBP family intramembrane glutamic endopeptidase [Candidatus Latescibacterota bacterium]
MKKARKITFWILLCISSSMSIPLVIWIVNKPAFFFNKIGVSEEALSIPYAWLLSASITTIYIWYTFKAVPFVRLMQHDFSFLKIIGIWAALVSGIIEEIFFRKMLMDWFLSMGTGNTVQVIVSATIFGIAHVSWILLRGKLKIALPVVLSTAALGALLGILYIVGGRNLLPCIAAHTLINVIIEPWLILSAVSGKMGTEDSSTASGN